MLFIFEPLRRIRQWFTDDNVNNDRFKKENKPTEDSFKKLFNSVAFILDRKDAAKEYTNTAADQNSNGIQGLVVKARKVDVQTRTEPDDKDSNNDRFSYATSPINLPTVESGLLLPNDSAENINNCIPADTNLNFTVTQDQTITVEHQSPAEPHSIWYVRISNKFRNEIYEKLCYLKDLIVTLTTNLAATNTNLATTNTNLTTLDTNTTNSLATKLDNNAFTYDDYDLEVIDSAGSILTTLNLSTVGIGEIFSIRSKKIGKLLVIDFTFKFKPTLSTFNTQEVKEFRLRRTPLIEIYSARTSYGQALYSGRNFDSLVSHPFVETGSRNMTVETKIVSPSDYYLRLFFADIVYPNVLTNKNVYLGNNAGAYTDYGFLISGTINLEIA
jgi:hypothetical protein